MQGTAAGGTGSGRKRWGWAALMAGAFLAGLLLVGVALIRAPEAERSTGGNLANSPAAIPPSSVPSDNGAAGPAPSGPRLAIVVDDLGYDPVRDAEWLDFPERITVSVLPQGPSSRSFAASARTRGFGVILHVPMESEGGVADRTEPFLLRRGMTPEEIADRFARMAADVSRQLKLPDMQERFAGLGVDAAGTTPAEFGVLFRTEVEMWAKVVKAANVRLD